MVELLLCFLRIKFCAYPRLAPAKSGQQRAFFESRPPSRPQGGKNDPRPNVPDPLCGAVWLAGGRVSDPRLLSCLQRRSFCILPSCCLYLQSAQFVLLMRIQHLMEWTDCVEQAAVVLETGPGEYGGVLCADEPFVSESADVLAHRIDAQLSCCTNG